jgi:Flp pilus assembly protein TadD
LGREDDAALAYEQAVRLNPYRLDARNNLGIYHARRGDAPRARAEWEFILKADPAFTPARQNLSRLQEKQPAQ